MEFFSAGAMVGAGIQGWGAFRTPGDLVRHMDRLGVARSVVWAAEAAEVCPVQSNPRLLDAVGGDAALSARLVPGLVLSATMLHERGSADELERMVAGGARALRAFPSSFRQRLRHLEPLLARLMKYRPVLFVDVRQTPDERDVCDLADRFPALPIVCMEAMWGHLLPVYDAMRRCPNVHVETSWLHTHGTIEYLCREFGAGRVVFGTGRRAMNGASIGGLLHAAVAPSEREAIAGGTLARLLGLPAEGGAPGPARCGALWDRFARGEPLGVDVVDAHAHVGASGWWPLGERDVPEQVPAALERMDRHGISTTIVSGHDALFLDCPAGNAALERQLSPHGGRFMGYFTFNPFYGEDLVKRFDDAFSRPFFAGFKLLCDYWQTPVSDPRFEPVWRYAAERRLPILLHTWEGTCDSPALLSEIVPRYPEARFLLGHSGGGDRGRLEAERLALASPNVVLEFCGSFCAARPWEETLAVVGPDRVVFGTDGIFHDVSWELARLLSVDVPDETKVRILGANMRAVLARRR